MNILPRSLVLVGCTLLASLRLFADTLVLADGRKFEDATVVRQSPRTVTLRHADGLASFDKKLLPPAWLARYPIDEAAARLEEEKRTAEAAVVPSTPAAVQPVAAVQPGKPYVSPTVLLAEAAEARKKAVLARAGLLVKREFETKFEQPLGGSVQCNLKLADAVQLEGWPDKWRVVGQAQLRYFRDLPPNPERDRIVNADEIRGKTKKQIKREIANEAYLRTEIIDFEAFIDQPDTAESAEIRRR